MTIGRFKTQTKGLSDEFRTFTSSAVWSYIQERIDALGASLIPESDEQEAEMYEGFAHAVEEAHNAMIKINHFVRTSAGEPMTNWTRTMAKAGEQSLGLSRALDRLRDVRTTMQSIYWLTEAIDGNDDEALEDLRVFVGEPVSGSWAEFIDGNSPVLVTNLNGLRSTRPMITRLADTHGFDDYLKSI